MKYLQINDWRKDRLLSLIDWLVKEVHSIGGDGDSIWYSEKFSVKDILPVLKEYHKGTKGFWEIDFDEESGQIHYGQGEEWLLITNNKSDFDNRPNWQWCSVCF